jgi:hypothetical protein
MAAGLHRVADLAVSIHQCMSRPGRNRYSSERQLRGWLAETTQFSAADVGPALSLLEAVGLLVRPPVGLGQPRPGHLATEADRAPETPPDLRLCRIVLEVARPGPGRDHRPPTASEIGERLAEIDEEVTEEGLQETLQRLADVGQLLMVRKTWGHPIGYVARVKFPFDEVHWLESEICRVVRGRDEIGYEDEEQLRGWLIEGGVEFDDRMLELALGNLLMAGRLQTPMPERWEGPGARPTWLVDPPIHAA